MHIYGELVVYHTVEDPKSYFWHEFKKIVILIFLTKQFVGIYDQSVHWFSKFSLNNF